MRLSLSKDKGEKPIRVFIKQDPYDIMVKRIVEKSSDGTKNFIVVEPEKDNKAGWKFDITGCVRSDELGRYVEVIRGANRAIEIDTKNSAYNLSKLTNDEMKQFIEMKIFKSHFGKVLGEILQALKPYLFIMIVLAGIALAISGYNAYQISQLPQQITPVIIGGAGP